MNLSSRGNRKLFHRISYALVFLFISLSAQADRFSTEQNRVLEWSYTSSKVYGDPFHDLDLKAIITLPNGDTFTLPAFWAGGNEWRFRYASSIVGEHHFVTTSSDDTNEALHGQRGTIVVSDYNGENPLYIHGPLTVHSDRRHLAHEDGTPFFWLADSWWHGMTTRFRWPEDFKALTADRKDKGFSVIQFAIGFPCDIAPFDPRGQNDAGDPWEADFTTINPAYFDLVDTRFQWLLQEGLVPNVVGLWGYYMKFMGVEKVKKHWDYLIARYGAYPITWTLCGESTLAYYTDLADRWEFYKAEFREQWSEVARHIQSNDPFNRLLTVHPGPGIHDGKPPLDDMDAVDFIMVQSGHSGFHTLPTARAFVRDYMKDYPDMPIMHGEVCFEGMHGGGSGEKVQRFLFWTDMLSGTCGFSYGVEGIWQFNTQEKAFGVSPGGNNWGNVPWNVGAQYPGSKQVGIGKRILENFDWWKLEPKQDGVEQSNPEDVFKTYCAGIEDEFRIAYLYQFVTRYRKVSFTGLEKHALYQVSYYDPLTGDCYEQGLINASAEGKIAAPDAPIMQDWVLVMKKIQI